MAITKCPECHEDISTDAKSCPHCGKVIKNPVGILLGIGIFIAPIIFAWFTLKKGRSTLSKILAFGWLALIILSMIMAPSTENISNTSTPQTVTKTQPATPISKATYAEVNNEVGCDSKYSDDKKEDIFSSKYKDHLMTWSGTVELVESDNVSLNLDNFGTQDVKIDFKDKKAGYDLIKGNKITVQFIMKYAGGCFLPFTGTDGVIIK